MLARACAYRERGVQHGIVADQPHQPPGLGRSRQRDAMQLRRPTGCLEQAAEEPEQRGLAGAVGAKQRKAVPLM